MTICSSVKSRGRYMAHVFKHEARKSDDPAKSLRKELNDIESRINEMMLAADMNDPAPALDPTRIRRPSRALGYAEKRRHAQCGGGARPQRSRSAGGD